jgi:protein TonB
VIKSTTNKYRTPLLMIGLSISLGLALIAIEWKTPITQSSCGLNLPDDGTIYCYDFPLIKEIKPKTHIILSDNEKKYNDELKPNLFEQIQDSSLYKNTNTEIEIDEYIEEEIIDEPIEEVIELMPEEEVSCTFGTGCFAFLEQEATPKGGMKVFYSYLAKSLNYPRMAVNERIEGKVFIGFSIDKDGSIINTRVLRGIGGGCDEEALRILRNAPKWQPAKQRGRIVRQKLTMPITFKLS